MSWIEEAGLIAVIRVDDLEPAVPLAEALVEGGVRVLEFTYTNRLAGSAIERVRAALGDACRVGAGSILDPETARQAMIAGAEFIVTPALRPRTIEICRRYAIPCVIGAFTTTEILTAWERGADFIKVHPAGLAGPGYFKDILAPLPQVKLIPSGGVNLETGPAFLAAGAAALAVGSDLVGRAAVQSHDWDALRQRAQAYVAMVARARGRPR